jgi:hypothetical protein
MAVVTSYCDASGHEADLQAITVGGFIGDVGAWNRFSGRWAEALKAHGIAVPFRMTSFINGTLGFERFKDRPDLQTSVLRDLVKVINKHTRISFATTVLTADWNAVNEEYRLKECHCTPYSVAAFAVINKSIRWIGRKRLKFTEFVFEEGDAGRIDFEWLINDVIKHRPTSLERSLTLRFESALTASVCRSGRVGTPERCSRRLEGNIGPEDISRPSAIRQETFQAPQRLGRHESSSDR